MNDLILFPAPNRYMYMVIIMFTELFPGLEEEGTRHFEVSPDGKFIAFLGKYGRIHLVSASVCIAILRYSLTFVV